MPIIEVRDDGAIHAYRNKQEVTEYYNQQIDIRIQAMVKLMALGGDTEAIQTRIVQLNNERKQKLSEGL